MTGIAFDDKKSGFKADLRRSFRIGLVQRVRVERRFSWIIHEPGDVILSGAPAKNFRPTGFAGRAGAQSKDPYTCKKSECGRPGQQM